MSNKSLAKAPQETCVLVTGGAGFIGSHTVVELLNKGYSVVVYDDLSNSSEVALDRVRTITGVQNDRLRFIEANILDRDAMTKAFDENDIDAIIHFAGFKAVGESVRKPLEYYWNNIAGTLVLCDVARNHGVKNIVFSSSATVYGEPEFVPITEDCPKHNATNPYGQTKSMLEQILTDLYIGDDEWNVVLLRYFNPIGAHESGLIGEDPKGIPNNLLPYVAQVAVGKLACVGVFGDDYDTPDGSCIRDFINVVDLAKAHVVALARMLEDKSDEKLEVFNIGTGEGLSVLQLLHAFEEATGVKVPHKIVGRREGDIVKIWADPKKANEVLGWKAQESIEDTMLSAWNWQKKLRERGVM